MTIQALAVFLISWVIPAPSHRDELTTDELPRWEKHPAEQRALRLQERNQAQLWTQFPRSW